MIDKLANRIHVSICPCTGGAAITDPLRTQPPAAISVFYRKSTSRLCVSGICGLPRFRHASHRVKPVKRICRLIERQQIHPVYRVPAALRPVVRIIIILHRRAENCRLLLCVKSLIKKRSIQPAAQCTGFPCNLFARFMVRPRIQIFVCHQERILALYGQHPPLDRLLCVILVCDSVTICVILPVTSEIHTIPRRNAII